ncbi:hypothetical protein D3C72_1955800 [compost metagenome]
MKFMTEPFGAPRRFSIISLAYGPVTALIASKTTRKPPEISLRMASKSNRLSISVA